MPIVISYEINCANCGHTIAEDRTYDWLESYSGDILVDQYNIFYSENQEDFFCCKQCLEEYSKEKEEKDFAENLEEKLKKWNEAVESVGVRKTI